MMFPASEEAVRAALRHWRGAVAGMGEVGDLMDRSEIVLAEVLNNIAEHGRVDAATGWIGLRCDPGPLGLRFVVTDRGRPLPPALLTPWPTARPCRRILTCPTCPKVVSAGR